MCENQQVKVESLIDAIISVGGITRSKIHSI